MDPVKEAESLTCNDCGQSHVAHPVEGFGATINERHQRALRFSVAKQMDMPTAYSVLLGMMSLNEVRRLQGLEPSDEKIELESATQRKAAPAPLLPDLDPGFQKAVSEGRLTIQEAMSRGKREVYASGLARRHGLSPEVAYQVADNRITLRQALQQREESKAPVRRKKKKRHASALERVLVIAFAVAAVAFTTRDMWQDNFGMPRAAQPAPPPPAAPVQSLAQSQTPTTETVATVVVPTRIQTNQDGQLVQIVGPDPRAILQAYCEMDSTVTPLEVTDVVPVSKDARLGLFRDERTPDAPQAIRIRRDWRSGRWMAGDGRHPIAFKAAPALPADAMRVAVSGR